MRTEAGRAARSPRAPGTRPPRPAAPDRARHGLTDRVAAGGCAPPVQACGAGPQAIRDQDGALWAGQFLAARAALDASACARLISAVPDGRSEEYALMLLGAVSGRIGRIPVADREPWE